MSSTKATVCRQITCWHSSDRASICDDRNVCTHSSVCCSFRCVPCSVTQRLRISGQAGSSKSCSEETSLSAAAAAPSSSLPPACTSFGWAAPLLEVMWHVARQTNSKNRRILVVERVRFGFGILWPRGQRVNTWKSHVTRITKSTNPYLRKQAKQKCTTAGQ